LASLRETLRAAGGGLFETSREEAQKRGVITPLGTKTAGLGATPDEAKMSGTPAQKTSSIRSAIRGELPETQTLQQTLRQQQTRTAATAEEQQRLADIQKLQQFSGLEQRVEEMVGAQLGTAFATGPTAINLTETVITDPNTGEALTPEQISMLDRIVNPLSDGDKNQALLEFNQSLGRTTFSEALTAEEVEAYFRGQIEAAAGATAAKTSTLDELVRAGAIDFQKLGFSNLDEVASLIGMESTEELAGLTVEDLVQQIDSVIEEEYNKVEQLQTVVEDVNTSPTQRAEAKAVLREMGVLGIRAAESSLDQVAEDIMDTSTVTIAGQDLTIEEMLNNEYLSGLAKTYFTGTDEEKQLIKDDSDLSNLVNYLETHKEVFEGAVDAVEQGVADFYSLQQKNKDIANTNGGVIDDGLMDKLYAGKWDKITTEDLTESVPPIIAAINNKSKTTDAVQVKETIDFLTSEYTHLTDELIGFTAFELDKLGITNPSSEAWKDKLYHLDKEAKLDNLNSDNPDRD